MSAADRKKVDREWLRVWREVPALLRSRGLCGKPVGEPTPDAPAALCTATEGHEPPCGTPHG